jgi:arylsulfatase A-like enzyme/Flp pilus assembly protein TadD
VTWWGVTSLRGDGDRWSVVLVTFDTTRADHLFCYGYKPGQAPTLDLMARSGIRYANCYTPAPLTLPAHASIMTGLYPFAHGLRDNGMGPLDERAQTLAEVLRSQGYKTAAVVGAYVLDARFGLNQGFDAYDAAFAPDSAKSKFEYAEREAAATTDAALRWLEDMRDQPYFLWVHYFDPHCPYQAPGYSGTPASVSAYDAEIAYADQNLDRLLRRVAEIKHAAKRDTLVVFAGDHGEALWGHGEPTHGLFAYNETLHVPLIVYLPSQKEAGVVIESAVSLVDLYPSILAWLGIPRSNEVHGKTLPASRQEDERSKSDPRPLYFETHMPNTTYAWSPIEGVILGCFKYIEAPRPELYDLANDAAETKNLIADSDAKATQLVQALDGLRERQVGGPPLVASAQPLDREAVQKLRALGYAGGVSPSPSDGRPLPDPKDMAEMHRRIIGAQDGIDKDQYEAALGNLQSVIEADPSNPRASFLLMDLLAEESIRPKALDVARARMDRPLPTPLDVLLPLQVGLTLAQEGQFEEAAGAFQQAHRTDPQDPDVNFNLGQALLSGGHDAASALPYLLKAYESAPANGRIAVALAQAYELARQHDEALSIYETILSREPENVAALNNSSWLFHELRRNPTVALQRARQAAQVQPDNPRVQHTLGAVLLWQGEVAEAITHLERTVELDPTYAGGYYQLGLARKQNGDSRGAYEALAKAVQLAPAPPPIWLPDARARLAEP